MSTGSHQWENPRTHDVLFGRGSGPNDHEGNVYFRSLVKARKAEYLATNHRQTKANIARDVVRGIRNKGGRFLRKLDAKEAKKAGVPDEVDAWVCVDEKTIMEKAKQALRQKGEAKGQDKDASPLREAQVASATGIINDTPPSDLHQGAPESLLDYDDQGHTAVPPILPDSYISGELPPVPSSQETFEWRTYEDNRGQPIPEYMPPSHFQQDQFLHSAHQQGQGFLAEEAPPVQRYTDLNPERMCEQEIHRAAAAGYAEGDAIGDGPEDDDRRQSLKVEDLMRSFHRMGTDEMATSSSSNTNTKLGSSNSNDTMGTIEPIPMGASNVSMMMSSSTFSTLKGVLGESATPRGSFTRPGLVKRHTSTGTGSRKDQSVSSEMSLSFSTLDAAVWDNSSRSGIQYAQVAGGIEEEASSQKISLDPRPIDAMETDPDGLNRFGMSSINILKATLCDSGDTLTSSSGKMSMDDAKAKAQNSEASL